MTLPVVPIDSANEKQHRAIIATVLNELSKQYPKTETWTPVVRGSGTAGTYEIATNKSRYTRRGREVRADVFIVFAGTITGGGTGFIQITGLPFTRTMDTYPIGTVLLSGVDWTAGANLSLSFQSSSDTSQTLVIQQTIDNAANTQVPISGVAAGDSIIGSICYETDDP